MKLIDIEDEMLLKNLSFGGLSAKKVTRLFMRQPQVEAIPIEWIMEYSEKLKEGIKIIGGLDLAQYIKMHQDLLFYKTQLRIMVERWKEENG